jgi:hypothetical protein
MGTIRFAALVMLLLMLPVNQGRAQVDQAAPGTVFMTANTHFAVTIERGGAVLGTLTFPKGTLLSAVDEHRKPAGTGPGRLEFHGAFELRALPANEVPAAAAGGRATHLMSNAPVVLAAQGVDVLIENFP